MHAYMYMTKVISLSDEAYGNLKKLKNGKSFSEVILELTKEDRKASLLKLAGVWRDRPDIDKVFAKIRKERTNFRSRDVKF